MSKKYILFIVMGLFMALPSMAGLVGGNYEGGTITLKADTKNRKVYGLIMIGDRCDPVKRENSSWVNYTKGTPISIPACGDVTEKNNPYVVLSKKHKTIDITKAFGNSKYKQPNEGYPATPTGPEKYKLMVWREGLKDKPAFCSAYNHDVLDPSKHYDCTVSKIKRGPFDSHKTKCHCKVTFYQKRGAAPSASAG